MKNIKFLTLSELLLILDDQIQNYGGLYGKRWNKKRRVNKILRKVFKQDGIGVNV